MSTDNNDYLGEPIPLDSPEPAGGMSKIESGTGDAKLTPLTLEPVASANAGGEPALGSSKIRTFESTSSLKEDTRPVLKRPMNKTGQGATRVRTFHTRLNDGAFIFLDNQINEWIDKNEDVEVKFCNTTIGVVEGKRPEPHVIMTVWY